MAVLSRRRCSSLSISTSGGEMESSGSISYRAQVSSSPFSVIWKVKEVFSDTVGDVRRFLNSS